MELIFSKFGFDFDRESLKLNWGALKAARDAYILRLNGIYDRMLGNSKVTIIRGAAKFSGPNAVSIGEKGVPTTSLSAINIIFFNLKCRFSADSRSHPGGCRRSPYHAGHQREGALHLLGWLLRTGRTAQGTLRTGGLVVVVYY